MGLSVQMGHVHRLGQKWRLSEQYRVIQRGWKAGCVRGNSIKEADKVGWVQIAKG